MISERGVLCAFLVLLVCNGCQKNRKYPEEMMPKTPLIIAHRGAQSIYPEHTLEAYAKAIELGADFIEPDLVMTKDGILISRHEPYISGTTNIAEHPEFANRKTTKNIDGKIITDWFVSDFTLAEIKTLRARQARTERSKEYDNLFKIITFQEIIDLAKSHTSISRKSVGIYPELKHPTYHKNIGLEMVEPFLKQLRANGYDSEESPLFVQCFEVSTLQALRKKTPVRLVQLIGATGISEEGALQFTTSDGSWDSDGAPVDFRESGNTNTYEWFTTESGMQFVSTYADAIGPWKGFIIPYTSDANGIIETLPATDFVTLAHRYNLEVHAYTFRNEDVQWQAPGNPASEYKLFVEAGVDGFFTDNTALAVKTLKHKKN